MPELSPYFKAISRQPRFCPECRGPVTLDPLDLTWDGAMWKCGSCGWCQLELAPEAARMGQRGAEPKARIIKLESMRGARR